MHSCVRELQELYKKGRVSRREFLFYSTTLGMSASAAVAFLAACGGAPTATATISLPATPTQPVAAPTAAATKPPAGPTPTTGAATTPTTTAGGPAPKRGGTLRVADRVMKLTVPWTSDWPAAYRAARQVAENLTYWDHTYVVQGRLAEKWDVSEDLMSWTFYLRQGIKWNDGKDFTADDVVYTIQNLTKKDVSPASSGNLRTLKPENVKAKDKYTVTLQFDAPEIGVPYHLGHGTALILPNGWAESDWTKNAVGTGPFLLSEYVPSERVNFKSNPNYWGMGSDGKALPYLDEMIFTDYGEEAAASVAALGSNQSDFMMGLQVAVVQTIEGMSDLAVFKMKSTGCSVMRMQVDKPPFDNKDVRNALKLAQDREQILQTAYLGMGDLGVDAHIAPAHPDMFPEEPPKQDIEQAKALLAKAGYPDGIDVTIDVKPDPQWESSMVQIYKEQAAQAGIRVNIRTSPSTEFWNNWDKYDFAAVEWETSGALAIIMMNLAYRCGVGWNDTHFCDKDFEKMLDEAGAIVDVEERKQKMAGIQKYHRENGGVMNPFFYNRFTGYRKTVNGFVMNPAYVDFLSTYIA